MIYLSIDTVLYFIILAIFEFKLIKKALVLINKDYVFYYPTDEQVNLEKTAVHEKISEIKGGKKNKLWTICFLFLIQCFCLEKTVTFHETETNEREANGENVEENLQENESNSQYNVNHALLVYELQKKYGNLQAVKDVSFRVNEQECFGLLGVNGAGKSTAFRMMTGDEVLDYGVMYMGDKDYKNHKNYVSLTRKIKI